MIKKFYNNKLAGNLMSLSILQVFNMLIPLITFPYIVRIIGVEYFGLISVVLSIVMLYNIFIAFGFDLSAVKPISVSRNNVYELSKLFSLIMYSKFLLLIISVVLFGFMTNYIDYFIQNRELFWVTFLIIIGNVIFPYWLFQGLEEMKYITYFRGIPRVISAVFIFLVIKEESDYILVPLIYSIESIIGGLIGLLYSVKKYHLSFFKPNLILIIDQLNHSVHFFISKISLQGSRHVILTLVGITFNPVIVGYFTMVEKLYIAVSNIGKVLMQALYPFMTNSRNLLFFKRFFLAILTLSILFLIPILYFHEQILILVFDLNNITLSKMFVLCMLSVPFLIISDLLGYPLLASFGFEKSANNIHIYSSIIYLIFVFYLIKFTNIIYIIIALIFYNIIKVILSVYFVKKSKILE